METDEKEKKLRVTTLVVLIILTFCGLLAVFLGGFMAMMSPMAFDAPGSADNPIIYLNVLGLISVPFIAVASLIASWVFFYKRRHIAAMLSYVPLIAVLIFIAVLFALI